MRQECVEIPKIIGKLIMRGCGNATKNEAETSRAALNQPRTNGKSHRVGFKKLQRISRRYINSDCESISRIIETLLGCDHRKLFADIRATNNYGNTWFRH